MTAEVEIDKISRDNLMRIHENILWYVALRS